MEKPPEEQERDGSSCGILCSFTHTAQHNTLYPAKLAGNLKMDLWKTSFLRKPVAFRFHIFWGVTGTWTNRLASPTRNYPIPPPTDMPGHPRMVLVHFSSVWLRDPKLSIVAVLFTRAMGLPYLRKSERRVSKATHALSGPSQLARSPTPTGASSGGCSWFSKAPCFGQVR